MKKSTITLVIITIVSLALSVVFGVVSIVVLAGAAKKSFDDIDFGKYSEQVEAWINENTDGELSDLGGYNIDVSDDGNEVNVSLGGVNVSTSDGHTIDVGIGGIAID